MGDPGKPKRRKRSKPVLRLKALNPKTKEKVIVAAGWKTPQGHIRLKFSEAIDVSHIVKQGWMFTLFRIDNNAPTPQEE